MSARKPERCEPTISAPRAFEGEEALSAFFEMALMARCQQISCRQQNYAVVASVRARSHAWHQCVVRQASARGLIMRNCRQPCHQRHLEECAEGLLSLEGRGAEIVGSQRSGLRADIVDGRSIRPTRSVVRPFDESSATTALAKVDGMTLSAKTSLLRY